MSKGVRRRVFVRGRKTRTCNRNEREKGKGEEGTLREGYSIKA